MISELGAYQQKLLELTKKIFALKNQNYDSNSDHIEMFNLLGCLPRFHLEILHSNVLHYLLDTTASHGQKGKFLKLFLSTLIMSFDDELHHDLRKKITLFLNDIEGNIITNKEVPFFDGRIDLILSSSKVLIAIENKIYAKEQKDQISRYGKYFEEKAKTEIKEHLLFYLTPYGKVSEESKDVVYYCISYADHIRKWLHACIEEAKLNPEITAGLQAYLSILSQKILIPESKYSMDIRDLLLEKENHEFLKIQKQLHDALVPVRNKLREMFFSSVIAELMKEKFDCEPRRTLFQSIPNSKIWDAPEGGFLLKHKEVILPSQGDTEFSFYVEHDWKNLYYGLVGIKDNAPVLPTKNDNWATNWSILLNEKLRNKLITEPDGCWFAWKNADFYKKGMFDSDDFNYELASEMKNMVDSFVEEIVEYKKALILVLSETAVSKSNSQ